MSALDAYYRAARAYPGGLRALAARMQQKEPVLRNKLTGNPSNRFTLADAEEIDAYTGNAGLHEQAHLAGCLLLPDPEAVTGLACDTELMLAYAEHCRAVAASAAEFATMLADGRVEAHEVERYQQFLMRGRGLENRVLERLRQMQEPG